MKNLHLIEGLGTLSEAEGAAKISYTTRGSFMVCVFQPLSIINPKRPSDYLLPPSGPTVRTTESSTRHLQIPPLITHPKHPGTSPKLLHRTAQIPANLDKTKPKTLTALHAISRRKRWPKSTTQQLHEKKKRYTSITHINSSISLSC